MPTLSNDDKERLISATVKGASLGGAALPGDQEKLVNDTIKGASLGAALPGDEPPSGPPGVKLATPPGGGN